jgi:hypothetical protein
MTMKKDDQLDPRLMELLDELKPVSERNPQVAARARSRFLAEAVSLSENQRHSWWTTIFQQKEKFAVNLIISTLIIAGLLFGGGATVAAAQNDLPTGPLYQIKLVSEDASVWLAHDPSMKIEMLMEQAQTRTEEMAALASAGIIPPTGLAIRMQDRIQQALQLTTMLDDAAMTTSLDQIRTHLQTQDRLMTQIQDGTCPECEPILQQTRDMLQTQLGQVEGDLANPGTFRNQYQYQNQVRITQTPPATDSPVTPQQSCTPALDGTGQQNGNHNPPASTPMPQNNGTNQNNNENGNGNGSGNENSTTNTDGGGNRNSNGTTLESGGQGGRP